jgi:hypothetical protein
MVASKKQKRKIINKKFRLDSIFLGGGFGNKLTEFFCETNFRMQSVLIECNRLQWCKYRFVANDVTHFRFLDRNYVFIS